MPSLKQYRDKIDSVKNTRKITQAMKMVAAAKLRKAQEKAQIAQPYAAGMASILSRLAGSMPQGTQGPALLTGTGKEQSHLFVIVSSDRGLCGGFNGNLVRYVREQISKLRKENKTVKLALIGRKAKEALRRDYSDIIIDTKEVGDYEFSTASDVSKNIIDQFNDGSYDVVTLFYNEFKSVLVQNPSMLQLIPFQLPHGNDNSDAGTGAVEFEPDEETILSDILPRNLGIQIYGAMLDSNAGEQAARMTAMDNATRNAGDMINKLSLSYNRARQAHITKELIEIISGAEAV